MLLVVCNKYLACRKSALGASELTSVAESRCNRHSGSGQMWWRWQGHLTRTSESQRKSLEHCPNASWVGHWEYATCLLRTVFLPCIGVRIWTGSTTCRATSGRASSVMTLWCMIHLWRQCTWDAITIHEFYCNMILCNSVLHCNTCNSIVLQISLVF